MDDVSDPLIRELRTFVLSWSEHDPDCHALDAVGPAILDPATCTCGLTERLEELLSKLDQRLQAKGAK